MNKGRQAYSEGKLLEAIQAFQDVISLSLSNKGQESDPSSSESDYSLVHIKQDLDAYSLLGKTFMRLNRPQEAYDSFKVEVALYEKIQSAQTMNGASGGNSQSADTVEDTEESSTMKNSKDINEEKLSTAYSNFGLAAKRLSKLDEAVTSMQKAMSVLTKDNELSMRSDSVSKILQNLGQIHMARRDAKSAIDAYQKSLEIQISLNGADHANVALGYLCLARVPTLHSEQARKGMYDKVLAILDCKDLSIILFY